MSDHKHTLTVLRHTKLDGLEEGGAKAVVDLAVAAYPLDLATEEVQTFVLRIERNPWHVLENKCGREAIAQYP